MKNTDPDTQRAILNRLKRARGQLDGVIRLVEEESTCRDVVTQLSAVSTALNRAGFMMISTAMQHCLIDPEAAEQSDEDMTLEELEKLFLKLA